SDFNVDKFTAALDSSDGGSSSVATSMTKCVVYFLDYDGEMVMPQKRIINFEQFSGGRQITCLECYPLTFHPPCQRDPQGCREIWKTVQTMPRAGHKTHVFLRMDIRIRGVGRRPNGREGSRR